MYFLLILYRTRVILSLKVNPTWTDKIYKSNSPKLFMSTNSIITFLTYNARDKIWTYNLNIFRVPLYQVELLELNCISLYIIFFCLMEILGLEPKITICKIAVLPIKLYPLFTPRPSRKNMTFTVLGFLL